MTQPRSPFLQGALGTVYGAEIPDACPDCRYSWSISPEGALALIAATPDGCRSLLGERDGMAPADDGGWNATAYVWHLVDLARGWSERWVQLADEEETLFVGWDPDVLAAARSYTRLPTAPALWAIENSVASFADLSRAFDPTTTFRHGDWGTGSVGDALIWIGHEYVHHLLDIEARAR